MNPPIKKSLGNGEVVSAGKTRGIKTRGINKGPSSTPVSYQKFSTSPTQEDTTAPKYKELKPPLPGQNPSQPDGKTPVKTLNIKSPTMKLGADVSGALKPVSDFGKKNWNRGSNLPRKQVKGIVAHDFSTSGGKMSKMGNVPNYHVQFDKDGFHLNRPLHKTGAHARGGLMNNDNSLSISRRAVEGSPITKAEVDVAARAILFMETKMGKELPLYRHYDIQGGKHGGETKHSKEASWLPKVAARVRQMKAANK